MSVTHRNHKHISLFCWKMFCVKIDFWEQNTAIKGIKLQLKVWKRTFLKTSLVSNFGIFVTLTKDLVARSMASHAADSRNTASSSASDSSRPIENSSVFFPSVNRKTAASVQSARTVLKSGLYSVIWGSLSSSWSSFKMCSFWNSYRRIFAFISSTVFRKICY